ncbi:MAG: hypothetical protein ACI3U1_06485 [Peptococcaceae bacterium]
MAKERKIQFTVDKGNNKTGTQSYSHISTEASQENLSTALQTLCDLQKHPVKSRRIVDTITLED